MRPCFSMSCDNGKETEWIDNGTPEGFIKTTKYDCSTCEGTGEVEDYCYCYAHEPSECCCGAWDDIAESWYEEE